jgi:hypothetical protein
MQCYPIYFLKGNTLVYRFAVAKEPGKPNMLALLERRIRQ